MEVLHMSFMRFVGACHLFTSVPHTSAAALEFTAWMGLNVPMLPIRSLDDGRVSAASKAMLQLSQQVSERVGLMCVSRIAAVQHAWLRCHCRHENRLSTGHIHIGNALSTRTKRRCWTLTYTSFLQRS